MFGISPSNGVLKQFSDRKRERVFNRGVKSAVAAAQAVNATGINIDHEATMVEGSPQSAALSAVMSELGTALREAIPGAELSFDAAARPCY